MSSVAQRNSTIVLKNLIFPVVRTLFALGSRITPRYAIQQAARLMVTPMASSRSRALSAGSGSAVIREIEVGGNRLQIYVWGDPSNEPHVLFAHGWSSYGLRFQPWVARLRAAGYAVVSFDQQAHGRSSGVHANPLDFARNLLAVGGHFGPAAGLVAHSLGGTAAIRAMLGGLAPDRVVLIAPSADPVAVTRRFARMIGFAEYLCDALIARFESQIAVTFDEQQAHRSVRAIARPMLVIHDLDDADVPWEEGERYARHASDARLLTTTGLGHHRIACDEAVMASSLRFLKGEAIGERVVSSPNLPFGMA